MLLMPIYFSALHSLTSSTRMNTLFPGRRKFDNVNNNSKRDYERKVVKIDRHILEQNLIRARLLIPTIIMPTIWTIVSFSDAIESTMNFVGVSIAVNCLLSCAIPVIFAQVYRRFQPNLYKSKVRPLLVNEFRKITAKTSGICYYMLLSVVGASTSFPREIIDGGWAPSSSFVFAAISLLVHFLVIIAGSFGMMRLFPYSKQFPLRPEEIAVASCAAITGPQAAVSLAIKLSHENRSSQADDFIAWRGLILSGTFLGIVGYIISCPVGVFVSRSLLVLNEKWQS